MKCNQSGPGFELVSPCPYPATITITPRAPSIIIQWIEIWRVRRPNVERNVIVQIISHPFFFLPDVWIFLNDLSICLSDFFWFFQNRLTSLHHVGYVSNVFMNTPFDYLFRYIQFLCNWLTSVFINCLLNFTSKFGCSHWIRTYGIFYVLITTLRYHFLFLTLYVSSGKKPSFNSEKMCNI